MKKIFRNILLTIMSILPLLSCEEEQALVVPILSANPNRINVAAEDVTASFQVKSNAVWTVTCSDSWITSYTKSGNGNGTVNVDFTPNADSQSERRADILVAVSGKTVKVILTQGKAGIVEQLSCGQNAVTVPPTAVKAEFQIKSNTAWKVSTSADWIRSLTPSGTDDGILTVEFDPYTESHADRTAEITVSTSKLSLTLTLTQTKSAPKESAREVTTRQFNEAADDPAVLYRMTGFVDKIVSMKHGSLILRDAFGIALIYCLKTAKDGEDGQFGTLGINVGDIITVVGYKSRFGEDSELVGGYHESHKVIERISIDDYLARADGLSVWYRLDGKVADISDESRGTLVLEDPVTGTQVTVNEVVSDYGAAEGSFASLGVKKGCELSIIASSKVNGKVAMSIYLDHAAGKIASGIFAKWGFNEQFVVESSFDKTYTGNQISAATKTDARSYDNKAGDGGKYIEASEGEGRMTFVQVDKTSLDPSGKIANRLVYYTAQPGAGGLAVGDYFLFSATGNVTVPAGTQIKFAFVLRPAEKSVRYWMLEFLDGDQWKPFGSLQKQTVTVAGVDYEYNVERTTNDESLVEAVAITSSDCEDINVRIRVSAPVCPNGTNFAGGISTGEMRFRGENKFSSPYIEIL